MNYNFWRSTRILRSANRFRRQKFTFKSRSIREGVHRKKTFLNGHCPDRSYPPSPRGNGQRGPFFRPSKTTFKRVLQNQIPIDYDDENDDYDDDNGDNFDDYDDDNDQKPDNYHDFVVKIYPFKALLLGKKKDQTNWAGVYPAQSS